MKVRSIGYAGKADVFNMEVDETHDFAVNGGVIVHNCYDEIRYVCMKNPISPRIRKEPPPVVYDPLELSNGQKAYDRYDFYRRY